MINAYIILLITIIVFTIVYACLFGKESIRNDKKYLLIVFLIIFTFMIIRESAVGIDSGNYQKVFDYCSERNIIELFTAGRHEIGYKILNRVVYLLGGDFWTLIILVSGFTTFSYYFFIKKCSKDYLVSICIFLGLDFFIFSFGILRETIAIGFILFAILAIIERKPVKFYVMVLLGALFHNVAIIFTPVYLLCKFKLNKTTISIWALAAIVVFFMKKQIINFILENIYSPVGLNDGNLGSGGYIMLFAFFAVSICALAVYYLFNMQSNRKMSVFIKILMMGTIVQEFATYYSLLYRVSILFLTVVICLIPIIMEELSKKMALLMEIAIALVMLAYYSYRAIIGENGFVEYSLNKYAVTIISITGLIVTAITIMAIMQKKRKIHQENEILFLVTSLSSRGGAERIIVSLANWIVQNKKEYKPTILILDGKESAYEIDERVRILRSNKDFCRNRIVAIFQRVKYCFVTIRNENPKYIVTFFAKTTLYARIAATANTIIIGSERANPRVRSFPDKIIDKIAFNMCNRFIFQTSGVQRYFDNKLHKSVVIPNPINEKAKKIDDSRKEKRIIAVGRLNKQKGFDVLIAAFKKVSKKNPDYSLVIYGDGEEEKNLLFQIQKLGLSEKVKLMGCSETIAEEMSKSKIFVLSSRYEGMPNALIEAMASGVACISTNCDFGPSDLIEDGKNGILVNVDNINELSIAINELIRNNKKRMSIEKEAYKINGKLRTDVIYDKYFTYIIGDDKSEQTK